MSEQPHLAFAVERVIVMCAPNGARRGAQDHPEIPLTPDDMAQCARDLVSAGVSVLHLHVRDDQGHHTLDVSRYRASIDAVHRAVGEQLVIQVTTESLGLYSVEQQMSIVRELKPEAVSLALNELCPDEGLAAANRFFTWLRKEGIWPQYILYSPHELRRFDALRRRGVFGEERPFCLFVLGSYANQLDGTTADINDMLAAVDCAQFPWAACCFGRNEQLVMSVALDQGGHVRLGFENNLWLPDGRQAKDNADLVKGFLASSSDHRRKPATAHELREVLLG